MALPILVLILSASPAPAVGQTAPENDLAAGLVEAAIERTRHRVVYDGGYRSIEYPGGDVPEWTPCDS